MTGTVEAVNMVWAGGFVAPMPIVDGKVDGSNVSFQLLNNRYAGQFNRDTIRLERVQITGKRPHKNEEKSTAPRPAIGPPPDGSDPSSTPRPNTSDPVPVVLRRVKG